MDFGYMDVTATCPTCFEEVTVRIFGQDGATITRTVKDSSDHVWAIDAVITVEGYVTDYELTTP